MPYWAQSKSNQPQFQTFHEPARRDLLSALPSSAELDGSSACSRLECQHDEPHMHSHRGSIDSSIKWQKTLYGCWTNVNLSVNWCNKIWRKKNFTTSSSRPLMRPVWRGKTDCEWVRPINTKFQRQIQSFMVSLCYWLGDELWTDDKQLITVLSRFSLLWLYGISSSTAQTGRVIKHNIIFVDHFGRFYRFYFSHSKEFYSFKQDDAQKGWCKIRSLISQKW